MSRRKRDRDSPRRPAPDDEVWRDGCGTVILVPVVTAALWYLYKMMTAA